MEEQQMMHITDEELVARAFAARAYSYSPYSHFAVGAALLAGDGSVYTGCNVENASFPAGNCAERTAVFKAVSEGQRDFVKIAVAGSSDACCMPCGICLQVLSEFADPEQFIVLCAASKEKYKAYRLSELLPHGFRLQEPD